MTEFAVKLREFAAQSSAQAALVHKKVAIEMFARVIQRTPVDTGRLRGNWQAAAREFARGAVERDDPSGSGTVALMTSTVLGAEPHVALTLTNNLPYARRIEYDNWSRQAPNGMVRVTAAEFRGVVAEIAGQRA